MVCTVILLIFLHKRDFRKQIYFKSLVHSLAMRAECLHYRQPVLLWNHGSAKMMNKYIRK